MKAVWPKHPVEWIEGGVLNISITFTWDLPYAKKRIASTWMPVRVGGPAVYLMPDYLKGCEIGFMANGVLQRINPYATRSTVGCHRKCNYCAVPTLEGEFRELSDWADLPIYCDNNILKSSIAHFDRVMDRLERHGWGDFAQGTDARILNEHHAERIARVPGLDIRLALDNQRTKKAWERAFKILRDAKIQKKRIRTYAMVGYDTGVDEAWERCKWIESHGVKPVPLWYHALDSLKKNTVTKKQEELGWTDYERRRIMAWFYWHREAVK